MKTSTLLKILLGAVIGSITMFYIVYLNPNDIDDRLFEKKYEDLPINIVMPDKYEVTLEDNKTDLVLKGEKDEIASITDQVPYLYVQATEGEEIQDLIVNVRGLDSLGHYLEKENVTALVEKVEPEELDGKVVISGTPKKKIKGVEILEPITGYLNSDIKDNIGEIKVYVNAEGLEGEKDLKGRIVVLDSSGEVLTRDILEEYEVKVKVVTE